MHRTDNNHQMRLFITAAIFLGIFSIALTLSPAVRARAWDVDYRWDHWIGYSVWLGGFWVLLQQADRKLAGKDPALIPLVSLISGWGLLTIWRLTPTFGLRQTGWLGLSLLVVILGLRLPSNLDFLRRYKYIWLFSGLLLTSTTLIFGTNPMGFGLRLWLGCCGIYLQPSEPLKLLLVVYLAAYFADWSGMLIRNRQEETPGSPSKKAYPHLQVLIPTLIMTGLAVLLLLVQRDLGTASIFIFLYWVMLFLAAGWRWIPAAGVGSLAGAGLLGYQVFDVIRLRVDAWINPWLDPAGRSYQIVQSLIAVANGGLLGRGPGLGNPSLVPITHSDFIFAAIAEDGGLINSIGFFLILGLVAYRGLRIALHAADNFHRYLAAGLTAFLAAQSILIIGGNMRLLPLTGVTLPFVSYGGSSLLVSFIILTIFLHISASSRSSDRFTVKIKARQESSHHQSSITYLSVFFFTAIVLTSFTAGWWAVVRGPDLLTRTDNPRRAIADRTIPRGSLLDRQSEPIVETTSEEGVFNRIVHYQDLGSIIGYIHPVYGQSGLEFSLDPILRGEEGNDPVIIWWNQLLYGQPPPGLDVRLTLDLKLQHIADEMLAGFNAGLILINAENGEILVMASHPTYDPNDLEDQWEDLVRDDRSPLVNRVTQGVYPLGDLQEQVFIQAILKPEVNPVSLRLPLAEPAYPDGATALELSLSAAALINNGSRPAPIIAQMVEKPEGGWLLFSPLSSTVETLSFSESNLILQNLESGGSPTWHLTHNPEGETLTWFIGGTTKEWSGLPLAVVLVLEETNLLLAEEIGQAVLSAAMGP